MEKRTTLKTWLVVLVVLLLAVSTQAGGLVSWGDRVLPNSELSGLTKIAAGGLHSLALKSDGSIVGWGYDDSGQATPPSGTDFIAIAAGFDYGLAITKNYAGDFVSPYGVDFLDYAVLSLAWLSDDMPSGNWNPGCDISEPPDGVIDELDLAVFADNWLEGIE